MASCMIIKPGFQKVTDSCGQCLVKNVGEGGLFVVWSTDFANKGCGDEGEDGGSCDMEGRVWVGSDSLIPDLTCLCFTEWFSRSCFLWASLSPCERWAPVTAAAAWWPPHDGFENGQSPSPVPFPSSSTGPLQAWISGEQVLLGSGNKEASLLGLLSQCFVSTPCSHASLCLA